MSMLSQFRKPGGFQQLLLLMETSEPAKQKALLQLVAKEDPGWAHLLKVKALTFDRVLQWPEDVLMSLTSHLPDSVLAAAHQMAFQISSSQAFHEKWLNALPSVKSREIQTLSKTQVFTPAEKSAAAIQIVQKIRELEQKGTLIPHNFDPSLEWDDRLVA